MPAKVKLGDLKKMSREERLKLLADLRSELIRLETQRARGVVEDPGRMRYVKRLIARILTLERAEELKDLRSRAGELLSKGATLDKVSMQLGVGKSSLKRILKSAKE